MDCYNEYSMLIPEIIVDVRTERKYAHVTACRVTVTEHCT